jgi:hypothetical protein
MKNDAMELQGIPCKQRIVWVRGRVISSLEIGIVELERNVAANT